MKTISDIASMTLAQATGTITSDTTNVNDGDTVTIGSKTYTFKTALTPTEGEVLIGGDSDASLLNLIRAINHSGTPDTDYKCAAANTQVTAATSVTANAFAITAITGGLEGNSIATTTTSAHLSWGDETLTGGEVATIMATVSDETFTLPARQVTVAEYPSGNPNFSRAHRISDAAFFVLRAGSNTVALLLTAMSKIAVALETSLTFAPFINTQPVAASTSFAKGTITSNNTTPNDGDTVTIGNKTYTFKTTLTPTEGEVLINGSADAALLNLIRAINHTGTPDTDYKCAAAHTQVTAATSVTAHAFVVTSKTVGTASNAYGLSTNADPRITLSAATMLGGTAAATFTVADTSELSKTYAWYESADNVTYGAALSDAGIYSGTSTATLTLTPTDTSKTGYYYKCTITNAKGSTTTEPQQLTVT